MLGSHSCVMGWDQNRDQPIIIAEEGEKKKSEIIMQTGFQGHQRESVENYRKCNNCLFCHS